MIFNFIRKIANLFGIQILKVSTYDRLVKNLSLEAEANSELSNEIVQSVYKENYLSHKNRILLSKINRLKSTDKKLSTIERAYLLDTSSLTSDALDSLEKDSGIPVFFKERTQPKNINNFKNLFITNAKALAAIDFLQSKYTDETSLEINNTSEQSIPSEAHKLFLANLHSKRTQAFEAINFLQSKYADETSLEINNISEQSVRLEAHKLFLFNLHSKRTQAFEAIDFLQSKYADDTYLENNNTSEQSIRSEAHKLFLANLESIKTQAFEAISLLENKYSTSLQGSKYYE